MTTERTRQRARSVEGRPPITPAEWRLGLTAALGFVYLAAWSGLSATSQSSSTSSADADAPLSPRSERMTPPTTSAARRTVWFDRMPIGERPILDLPPGYRLASSDARTAEPTLVARNDRPPRRSPIRIRTRSS